MSSNNTAKEASLAGGATIVPGVPPKPKRIQKPVVPTKITVKDKPKTKRAKSVL